MKGMYDECSDKLISYIKAKYKNKGNAAFVPRFEKYYKMC